VKRGKYLTIPLDAAKDPKTHVPTFTSAYHIDFNTFVFRSKKGKRFIAARFPSYSEAVQELGLTRRPRIVLKQGRTVVLLLYLLRKRVTLPKRLKFKETFLSAPMVKDREERLSSAIQGSLSRAFARLG